MHLVAIVIIIVHYKQVNKKKRKRKRVNHRKLHNLSDYGNE